MNHEHSFGLMTKHGLNFEAMTDHDSRISSPITVHNCTILSPITDLDSGILSPITDLDSGILSSITDYDSRVLSLITDHEKIFYHLALKFTTEMISLSQQIPSPPVAPRLTSSFSSTGPEMSDFSTLTWKKSSSGVS